VLCRIYVRLLATLKSLFPSFALIGDVLLVNGERVCAIFYITLRSHVLFEVNRLLMRDFRNIQFWWRERPVEGIF
jgi:hypothetical protein